MIERLVLILALINGTLGGRKGNHDGHRFIIGTPPLVPVVCGVTCELDPVCYRFTADCMLNANDIEPFVREAAIDCLECSALCQTYRNGSIFAEYYCRSAVWDACNKTCDLYAIKAPSSSVLTKHPGRIYMEPTDNCRLPPPGTEAPVPTESPILVIPSCRNATDAGKMVGVKNQLYQNMTGEQLLGISDDQTCAGYCLHNQLPNGTTFNCKSAQFVNGICIVSGEEALSSTDLVPTETGTYFQKFCFKAALVEGCPDIFLEEQHMILVGTNRATIEAVSLDACMKACLSSQEKYGFTCKSVMFYYQDLDQNCILNEETKTTKKELFVEAPEDDEVSYVEVGCKGTANKKPVETSIAVRQKDTKHFLSQKSGKAPSKVDFVKERRRNGSTTRAPSIEGRIWRTTRRTSKLTPTTKRPR